MWPLCMFSHNTQCSILDWKKFSNTAGVISTGVTRICCVKYSVRRIFGLWTLVLINLRTKSLRASRQVKGSQHPWQDKSNPSAGKRCRLCMVSGFIPSLPRDSSFATLPVRWILLTSVFKVNLMGAGGSWFPKSIGEVCPRLFIRSFHEEEKKKLGFVLPLLAFCHITCNK